MPAPQPIAGFPSFRQAAAGVLRAEVLRHGRGLTVPEWRAACLVTLGGQVPSFLPLVRSLRERGEVSVVGGRVRHLRYAPSDLGVVERDAPPDFVMAVREALVVAEAAGGGPVSVRMVTAALAAAVTPDGPHAVRNALRVLATPSGRGPTEFRHRIYSRTVRGPAGHRQTVWSTHPIMAAQPAVMTRTDAVRRLVAEATADFGMPVSASWLRVWADATGATRHYLHHIRPRLRNALHDTARRRATTRLVERTSRWAGLPPWDGRYVLGAVGDEVGLAAAELEDFVVRADLSTEADSLAVLEGRARLRRPLGDLVDLRLRLLGALVAEVIGTACLEDVLGRLLTGIETRRRIASSRAHRATVQRLAGHYDAFRRLQPRLRIAKWHDRPTVIGEAGLMEHEAETKWVSATVGAADASPRAVRRAMEFRAGILVGGELRLDALRALDAVAGYVQAPRLAQRIGDLAIRMGSVWRDPSRDPDLSALLCGARLEGHLRLPRAAGRHRIGALWGILEA